MSRRPSQPPSGHSLREVLAAGEALRVKASKAPKAPKADPGGVLDNQDVLDSIALQIVRRTFTEEALFDEFTMLDLCEQLRAWCTTQRVPCSEAVYKEACRSLGISSPEHAKGVLQEAGGGDYMDVTDDPNLWFRTFKSLCAIHTADTEGQFLGYWAHAVDLQRMGASQLKIDMAWWQLLQATVYKDLPSTYDPVQNARTRLLGDVAQGNLDQEKFNRVTGAIDELKGAVREDDVDRFKEIMSTHGLRPWSGYIDGLSADVPEEERGWEDIDFLVMMEDVDRAVGDEMVAGRCTKHILADPDYTTRMGAAVTNEVYVPPLVVLAATFQGPSDDGSQKFNCFRARLRHPSADYVLRYRHPMAGHNIVHVICASPIGHPPGPIPFAEDLVEWRRKKEMLLYIAERCSRKPRLMKYVFDQEGVIPPIHDQPLSPVGFWKRRWRQYQPRLLNANPAELTECMQIYKSTRDFLRNAAV